MAVSTLEMPAPFDFFDTWLASGLDAAGLLVVLVLAVLLGLRHATDPDHLVAVTALVSGHRAGPREAQRLGIAWGCGHAAVLFAAGVPLIALDAQLPAALEAIAELLVLAVIAVLLVRAAVRVRRRAPVAQRSRWQAAGVGVLHGLGGTGAIVLLLATQLPTGEAIAALALFAPASVASMALCSRAYAHALARIIT